MSLFPFVGSHWLTPGEQGLAIKELLEAGDLIKWDNKRTLPLKSGGMTDIYINLRLMRNHPGILRFLAELYANPIRRLRVNRLVEVPEAVSPLAGHISAITDIPLVTVREEAKAGRVVKGKLVGDIKRGDRVVIVDDVVTDGASKLAALAELRSAGADIAGIVVLVDRQQGWKKKLAENGFGDVDIWSAMTLHRVRQYLVENKIMDRCDPAVEAKNPLIIALDGKPWEEVLPIVDRLRPSGCILKANDLLLEGGPDKVVRDLSVYGRVMADPKWNDIPNTVANYCRRLREHLPWGVTVHANGGGEMIRAAVEALKGTPTLVIAITVLTSIKEEECETIYYRRSLPEAKILADLAYQAGARGFVCSSQEAAALHQDHPDVAIIVPGLRSPDRAAQDQQRVGTFAGAKEAGASYFVGGRQFLTAPDPVAEIFRVAKEELGVEL